ncbi:hypothetical protein ABT173_39455 [Streptomyces sp. NPDC001795]|uniref:hypothetical protein n=1 Tax=unclassified Streptomyces TaxID=2593676 RepID=UPI00332E4470
MAAQYTMRCEPTAAAGDPARTAEGSTAASRNAGILVGFLAAAASVPATGSPGGAGASVRAPIASQAAVFALTLLDGAAARAGGGDPAAAGAGGRGDERGCERATRGMGHPGPPYLANARSTSVNR